MTFVVAPTVVVVEVVVAVVEVVVAVDDVVIVATADAVAGITKSH